MRMVIQVFLVFTNSNNEVNFGWFFILSERDSQPQIVTSISTT